MPGITPPPTGKIVNRHREVKQAAKAASTVASVGISVAQYGTGTGALAMIAGSAAAVSATGIGLVVAGGVLTVAASLNSGRSAYKTHKHINNLKEILENKSKLKCEPVDAKDKNVFHHRVIEEQVLPYVISQKKWKRFRKAGTIVPGAALLEGLRAVAKKGYKYAAGTLGVERENAAKWLTQHLLTHNCELCDGIVAELYGHDEMLWLKQQEGEAVVHLLMDKLKST